ncbi:MAG TPA: N-6 DNA methylase [Ignavibacteriaceae bacterium]|nr:N-6 DNA methylase [Ignavibacteriaceae bacterium]
MAIKKNETNERELTSKLSEWFNEEIRRNKFPFKEATNEAPAKYDSTTYFGDIILWVNRESRQAFSYIEIKPPFAIKENLETLRKKAISYGVKYCFTWDFQNFNAYELKENKLLPHAGESTSVMNNINDWLRGDVQSIIKKYIRSICEEIVNINETGKFRKFIPDKVYFVNYIRETVNKLFPQFEKHYLDLSKDKTKRSKLIAYGREQGIAFNDPADYYRLIARQSDYNLITKVIFYLTVRRYFDELPDLYLNDIPDLEKYLREAFVKAQEKDWQAVFEESEVEGFGIPKSCYKDLNDFFAEMKVYHFGELPEDVIGELFEEIIEPDKRHLLGQYFTNENLIDFILGFVVNNEKNYYADTTCGSGTFLIRLYDRLKFLSKKITHNQLLDKIWGFDIAKFPAELSTINLFRQDVSNFENFPRVRRTDIFKVNKGDEYEFPPPSANKTFKKIKIKLPQFNAIVGNFPFIRQELIEKVNKGYKLELTKVLAHDYFLTYPKLFITNNVNQTNIDHLKKLTHEQFAKELNRYVDKGFIQLKLSGQADIYTYIFIHTATLLAEKGQFAVITSNSWLDVSYGSVLKEFFLDNFKVKAVIASWAEPWFDDAAVNTIVTILEKESDKKERDKNVTRFVKLKKKFTELIPYQDLKLESVKRWQKIDWLVDLVETANDKAETEVITENISSFCSNDIRVRLVKQTFLKKEIEDNGELSKWSQYLKAPDIYFEILEICSDRLIPLSKISETMRGSTTGVNDFFYLKKIDTNDKIKNCVYCSNGRGWSGYIEEDFLKPIIKSPKESDCIFVDKSKLQFNIFVCNESKSNLKKSGSKFALKYIEWGEKQKTKENVLWSEVPSVKGREYWYSINVRNYARVFWTEMYFDSFRTLLTNEEVLESDKFYRIETKAPIQIGLYLNSSLVNLFREINAFQSLGDGVLKSPVYEVENILVPKKLPKFSEKSFSKFLNREIKTVFEEVKQKDRNELDTKILEALGLDAKLYLPKIYEGLCELVKERLELPKMRKKKQKEVVKYAYDKVKQDVIEDCLPEGVRNFPQDFYTKGNYEELKFESYSTNGQRLFTDTFFNSYQMKTEEGETIIELDSEAKAEFAEIISRQKSYQIKIPKEEKVVEQILKHSKNYISNLRDQLTTNAKEKLHDWAIAEKMSKEILDEYGLA